MWKKAAGKSFARMAFLSFHHGQRFCGCSEWESGLRTIPAIPSGVGAKVPSWRHSPSSVPGKLKAEGASAPDAGLQVARPASSSREEGGRSPGRWVLVHPSPHSPPPPPAPWPAHAGRWSRGSFLETANRALPGLATVVDHEHPLVAESHPSLPRSPAVLRPARPFFQAALGPRAAQSLRRQRALAGPSGGSPQVTAGPRRVGGWEAAQGGLNPTAAPSQRDPASSRPRRGFWMSRGFPFLFHEST